MGASALTTAHACHYPFLQNNSFYDIFNKCRLNYYCFLKYSYVYKCMLSKNLAILFLAKKDIMKTVVWTKSYDIFYRVKASNILLFQMIINQLRWRRIFIIFGINNNKTKYRLLQYSEWNLMEIK